MYNMCLCAHVRMYACMYVCEHVHMYTCTCTYIYIHTYIHTHTHTHIYKEFCMGGSKQKTVLYSQYRTRVVVIEPEL